VDTAPACPTITVGERHPPALHLQSLGRTIAAQVLDQRSRRGERLIFVVADHYGAP